MDFFKQIREGAYNQALQDPDRWTICSSCGCMTDLLGESQPIKRHYTDCIYSVKHLPERYKIERPK